MKLSKKNSIFTLYKEQILNFIKGIFAVFFGILVFAGIIACVFCMFAFELFPIVVYVLIWLYVGYYYLIYWWKIQRIPLTKKELNAVDIDSVEKFQNFLINYMGRYDGISNKNVKALCFRCSFVLLTDENERIKLLEEYFNEHSSKKEKFEIYLNENGIKNLKDLNEIIASRELNYSVNSPDWEWLDQLYWDILEDTEFDPIDHVNNILSIRNHARVVMPILTVILVAIFIVLLLSMFFDSIAYSYTSIFSIKWLVCPMCLLAVALVIIERMEFISD